MNTFDATVRGEDYLYLRCNNCRQSIVNIGYGTTLQEMLDERADHECDEEGD